MIQYDIQVGDEVVETLWYRQGTVMALAEGPDRILYCRLRFRRWFYTCHDWIMAIHVAKITNTLQYGRYTDKNS